MKHLLQIQFGALFVIIAAFMFSGCERDLDIADQMSRETEMHISYNLDRERILHGLPMKTIKQGDEAWEMLNAWFKTNYQYWHRTADNDQPSQHQVIQVRGNVLIIDIHDTHIYAGFNNEKGYFRSYWRSSNLAEFQFLLDLNQ